jgi:DNA polymerase-3 subunit beta
VSRAGESAPGASITVEAAIFAKALAGVVSVVQRRNTIPILSNVLISQKSGTVHLMATDLDREVKLPLAPVEFDGEMNITVDAQRLQSLFQNLDNGAQVKLVQGDNGRLNITSGRNRYHLPSLPAADMPQMPFGDDASLLTFRASDIRDVFARMAVAQSSEETRYYLCGLFMHMDADDASAVRFAATNGHKLIRMSGVQAQRNGDIPDVIIPSALVAVLSRLWANVADDTVVEVYVTASKLRFSFADWQVTGKVVDGSFPDYVRVIPTQNDQVVTVDCDHLISAAKRVMVLNSKKTPTIRCNFESDKLTLSVNDPSHGQAAAELPIEYSGDPMEVGINGQYLIEMAGAVPGSSARLSLADPRAPTLWKSLIDNAGFSGVVMPIGL